MPSDYIGDMSVQELMHLIETVVDQRMQRAQSFYRQQSKRPIAEIIQEMRELRITRDKGEPSVAEMIQEERNR